MPMMRDLEVAFDPASKTWGLRWKRSTEFYQTGYKTRDEAGECLWNNFDDCD